MLRCPPRRRALLWPPRAGLGIDWRWSLSHAAAGQGPGHAAAKSRPRRPGATETDEDADAVRASPWRPDDNTLPAVLPLSQMLSQSNGSSGGAAWRGVAVRWREGGEGVAEGKGVVRIGQFAAGTRGMGLEAPWAVGGGASIRERKRVAKGAKKYGKVDSGEAGQEELRV